MRFRGGEFSTGTMGNFQPELTVELKSKDWTAHNVLFVGAPHAPGVAGESTDAMVDASSQMPQAQAAKKAPDRFILTMALRSIFVASNHIKAADLGLQAQAGRRGVLWRQAHNHFPAKNLEGL